MLYSLTFLIVSCLAMTLIAVPPQHHNEQFISSSMAIASYAASYDGSQASTTAALNPQSSSTLTPSPNNNNNNNNNNSSSSSGSNTAGISSTCFRPNNIPLGWLPEDVPITAIQSQVSSQGPCTYGSFAHITSTTGMPDKEIQGGAAEAAKAGAVFTIALQPWIPFAEVDPAAVAESMRKLLGVTGGKTVWLRLAHEVNWYIDTNPRNTESKNKYHGTTSEFKIMWTAIAKAVDRSKVKMFWSPVEPFQKGETLATLNDDWYPGDDVVDIVGIDAYGQIINGERMNFDKSVGAFCDFYKNKPMHLGETGWLSGGTPDQKKYWLEQVSSPAALERCSNYIGFSWFERYKFGDYRIVTGSGGNIAKSVLGWMEY